MPWISTGNCTHFLIGRQIALIRCWHGRFASALSSGCARGQIPLVCRQLAVSEPDYWRRQLGPERKWQQILHTMWGCGLVRRLAPFEITKKCLLDHALLVDGRIDGCLLV